MSTPEKNRKKPNIIGIILCSGAVFLVYVISFIMVFDKADVSSSMRDIVSIFTCITTALSVALSGASIVTTLKQHQEDRQAAIFTRWYNEIILNRHLDKIRDFCNNCEILIAKFKNIDTKRGEWTGNKYEGQIKQDVITPFTDRFTCIHKSLVRDLALIDGKLSVDVSKIFQELQDDFVNELSSSHDDEKMYEIVQRFSNNIMKQLMGYNKRITQGKGLSNWISE